ncbi:MAG: phosphate regulon sensor histidine kinase PhoR [Chromatiales bacterium]|nr:MAG: phosphate regulon sensor histidine kinase PhoR [Chromatiales bacterium]
MPALWVKTLLQHAAVIAAGLFIGWIYGGAVWGLLTAITVLLGWHIYHLYILENWLRTDRPGPVPHGSGPWSQVVARINAVKQRGRRNRRAWLKLIKEIRASTKALPDGGIMLTGDLKIVRCNKAARQLLGLKKKRDRGTRIDNLIRHPDFVSYLETGTTKESVEIPAPGSSERWLSCRLVPYGMDQKLLLVRDITQSVAMERMRRDFVANASHELRSPLTVITGYLGAMAEDDTLPETWRAPVLDMNEQVERMGALIRDLLTLSKLESSESCPRDHRVKINAILEAARRDALMESSGPRRIELTINSHADILGEQTEIQSIVSNLVNNAVRYTPEDGSVTIGWHTDKKGGHLSVADTGIGIPADDIPRLTERFYRADSGRARQKGGTGLGLAIVKHALKRHDAELEINSEVGAGSEFVCHFPADRLAAS